MESTTKYTNADMLAGKCTYNQYMRQFVTEEHKRLVLDRFGLDVIMTAYANDEHLNNIPLWQWDCLAWGHEPYGSQSERYRNAAKAVNVSSVSITWPSDPGFHRSQASAVSLLKAAARELYFENAESGR